MIPDRPGQPAARLAVAFDQADRPDIHVPA
ncbi:MAG: hypothetical protein JWO51_4154, partial [Rhodospirillales bacterium]|nr:hypothetical protein [Rhodospirillales bacterium]